MDFAFDAETSALHERMRALGPTVAASDDPMAALAEAGVLGLSVATAFGGGGRSLLAAAHAFEGLGYAGVDGGLLLAAGAHLFGVAMTLQRIGTEAQQERWLPDLAAGRRLATVGATEHDAGSDIGAVTTAFEATEGGYSVRGRKRYVTWADRADCVLVVGRTGEQRGLTCALVDRDAITAEPPYDTEGLAGARLAAITIDGTVPEGAILGRPGGGMAVFQASMTYERALVLAFRLGVMERQLEEAIDFARRRKVGGTAVSKHQAVSHRVARMKARLESSRLLCYRAAWAIDQGDRRSHADAALAKWHLADAAVENALDALRVTGGAGYLREAGRVEPLVDALGGTIHSGTGDVLANIVAGWLGL